MNPEILKAAAEYEAARATYELATKTADAARATQKDANAAMIVMSARMAHVMGRYNTVVINDVMYKADNRVNCLNSREVIKSIPVDNVTKEF